MKIVIILFLATLTLLSLMLLWEICRFFYICIKFKLKKMNKINKDYKKEIIDLSELPELVPAEYLSKINIVVNKDIPKEPKKSTDLALHHFQKLNEGEIQTNFCRMVDELNFELQNKNKFSRAHAVQIDNGDSAGGSLTQIQRINLYKRKKREGSKSGFPDFMIPYFISNLNIHNTIYVEVKRIAAPSGIKISKDQLKWFLELNKMGFNSYITNNPIFFKEVILKEIRNFK